MTNNGMCALRATSRLAHPLLCLVAIALLFSGCSEQPVTKPAPVTDDADLRQAGKVTYEHILATYGQYQDARLQAYIDQVGQRIVKAVAGPQTHYTFTLLDSGSINALMIPGGHVVITRGLVTLLNSESELAGVIAHELGHSLAGHARKQLALDQHNARLSRLLSERIGTDQGRDIAQTFEFAVSQGFSREQEFEADALAVRYLRMSGYDPYAVHDALRSMRALSAYQASQSESGGDGLESYEIFSDHPATDARIHRVVELLKAGAYPANTGDAGRKRYLAAIDGVVFGAGEREGLLRHGQYFNRSLKLGLRLPDGWSISPMRGKGRYRIAARNTDGTYLLMVALPPDGLMTPTSFRKLFPFLAGIEGHALTVASFRGREATAQTRDGVRIHAAVLQNRHVRIAFLGRIDQADRGAAYDQAMTRIVRSLHVLSKQELARAKAPRIHVASLRPDEYRRLLQHVTPQSRAFMQLVNNGEPVPDGQGRVLVKWVE